MPKGKASNAELVHQIVQGSSEPLAFAEIMRRVGAIAPITTRDPKGTIRGAINNSKLVVATGDGRYGWKPRLYNDSVLRLTLAERDLTGQSLDYSTEVHEALYPTFFASQRYRDVGPINVELTDDTTTRLTLDFLGSGHWGTVGAPDFWHWLDAQHASPGDHLLFKVLNGEAREFCVTFKRRAERDQAAINERNGVVVAAGLAFLRSRPTGASTWDVAAYLLSTGQYHHPMPPDPLSEIWTQEVWGPVLEAKGIRGGWALAGGFGGLLPFDLEHLSDRSSDTDALLERINQLTDRLDAMFGEQSDNSDSPHLPLEYLPGPNRRPRQSRAAQNGAAATTVLRVTHRDHPRTWREIELADDQTLEDLHIAIQNAYSWNDDHLYSFFMSGHAFDGETEIGSPWSDAARHTHQVTLSELKLRPEQHFLYLFDYGDNHEFDVEVVRMNPQASPGAYPKVVAQQGRAPRQY